MTRRAALIVVALVVAALVGVALLALPSSPMHKKPTLGLDLQGGLEITLQAVPPKGRKLTKEDLDRSVSIMRDRVDRLGVVRAGDPRRRAATRSRSSCPASRTPRPRRRSSARRRSSSSTTSRRTSCRRRSTRSASRSRRAPSTSCSPASRRSRKKGTSDQYWLFNKQKKLVVGPVATKTAALAKLQTGKVPEGWKLFAVPPETVVVSVRHRRGRLPGRQQAANPTQNYYYLFKYDAADRPGDDGLRPEALGHAAGLRHADERADRAMQFTKKGAKKFAEITRAEAQRGKLLSNTIGQGQQITSTSRSCSTARSSRGRDRLEDSTRAASPARTARRSRASARHQRGEGPRARAPDRRPPGRVRHARPDGDLGHARQGLAAARRRRPRSSASCSSPSSCSSSTASSASSPCSGSASTPRSSTPRSCSST